MISNIWIEKRPGLLRGLIMGKLDPWGKNRFREYFVSEEGQCRRKALSSTRNHAGSQHQEAHPIITKALMSRNVSLKTNRKRTKVTACASPSPSHHETAITVAASADKFAIEWRNMHKPFSSNMH